LEICETDLIAFMDDDAVAGAGWLEALVQAFETLGPRAAAVGGPIDPIWEMARPAWLADELLGSLTVVDWGGSLRFTNDREWIAGANMAFRTDLLRKAGGFGLALGRNGANGSLLSNEEIEVVKRLKAEGLGVAWAPKARVKHLVSRDRLQQGWFRKRYTWQAISDAMMRDGAAADDASAYWEQVTSYLMSLPPRLRTLRGLFVERVAPDDFLKQVHANYSLAMLMALGHHIDEQGGFGRPWPDAKDA